MPQPLNYPFRRLSEIPASGFQMVTAGGRAGVGGRSNEIHLVAVRSFEVFGRKTRTRSLLLWDSLAAWTGLDDQWPISGQGQQQDVTSIVPIYGGVVSQYVHRLCGCPSSCRFASSCLRFLYGICCSSSPSARTRLQFNNDSNNIY